MDRNDKIEKLYKEGKSSREIGKLLGCEKTTVLRVLKKRKVDRRSISESKMKYGLDVNFFEKIDTTEKAYVLGFFYADGFVNDINGTIGISLQKRDKEILEKIREVMKSERPIRNKRIDAKNRQDVAELLVTNKKIYNDAINVGVAPRKSHTIRFPSFLCNKLYAPFILGYFDGDGCINIFERRGFIEGQLNITSNEGMCSDFKKIIESNFGVKVSGPTGKIRQASKYIVMQGNLQVLKFMSQLYDSCSIFMKRKHDKYLELKKIIIDKCKTSKRHYNMCVKHGLFLQDLES